MPQSSIFPIFLRAEYRDSQAFGRFRSDAQRTAQAAKREFQGVAAALDAALSRDRNQAGSLDLGLEELREAARQQERVALAAREVADATRRAATANGQYNQSLSRSARAAIELANAEDKATKELREQVNALEAVQRELNQTQSAVQGVTQAQNRGTTATQAMVNSQRAQRNASIQAGQQMQDMVIQFQAGTRATTVMSQQVPQLAFALSGLTRSTNKTLAGLGRVATFLSGPFGTAFVLGIAVLGPFVEKLFEAEDASDRAKDKTIELTDALTAERLATEEATKAIQEYNEQQEESVTRTEQAIRNSRDLAKARLEEAIATLEVLKAEKERNADEILSRGGTSTEFFATQGLFESQINQTQSKIDELRRTVTNTSVELGEKLTENLDPLQKINDQYDTMIEGAKGLARANGAVAASIDQIIVNLNKQRGAALAQERDRQRNARRTSSTERLPPVTTAEVIRILREDGLIRGNPTSTRRDPNSRLGRANPRSFHNFGQAVDFIPTRGTTIQDVRRSLERRGVRVPEAIDEFRNPSGHATGGHFHIAFRRRRASQEQTADSARRAEEAERRAQEARERAQRQLEQFGRRSGEQIARINERFDEQPRLIDQASQATRRLDNIIKELGERKPPGFEDLVKEAEAAKETVQEALVRPLEELREQSEGRLEIEELLANGLQEEAEILQTILQLEEQVGELTEQQVEDVEDIIRFERLRIRELETQKALLKQQGDVVRGVADDLTKLLSGRSTDFFGNIRQSLLDLQGSRLFEDIFGDTFRDLEDELSRNSPVAKANRALATEIDGTTFQASRVEQALEDLADTTIKTTETIKNGPTSPGEASLPSAANDDDVEITVTAAETDLARKSIKDIAESIAEATVQPLISGFEDVLGPQFAQSLGAVLEGVMAGVIRGGTTGGVLGGLRGLAFEFGPDVFGKAATESILKGLDGALGGAQTGTTVGALSKALGLGGSTAGAQVGGALGSFIPIPGGDIIGAIAGNFLGSILGGTKRGSATITGVDSSISTRGNSGSRTEAASGLAGSVQDSLKQIADALGADAGNFAVSIGVRKDNFRVDTSGRGITKTSNGAIDFGQDEAAAIAFALGDAIADGAIKGLTAAENRLLQASGDIQKRVQDVLDFRNVFDRLKQINDPVGFALDQVNSEFEDLIDLFIRAGASAEEFAQLEELYGIERARAIEEATRATVGNLQDFLDQLTIGNDALSLRDRRNLAQDRFDGLAERVQAGDTTAFDEFTQVAQELLGIERQISGSRSPFFDLLTEITGLTEGAITSQQSLIDAANDADNPFGSGQGNPANDNELVSAIGLLGGDLLDGLGARLDAVNQNLGTLIAQGAFTTSGSARSFDFEAAL